MTKKEARERKYCDHCLFFKNKHCIDGELKIKTYRPGTPPGECPLTARELRGLLRWEGPVNDQMEK